MQELKYLFIMSLKLTLVPDCVTAVFKSMGDDGETQKNISTDKEMPPEKERTDFTE